MNSRMAFLLLAIIAVNALVSVVFLVKPASASCGDIGLEMKPGIQLYAPTTIELDFPFSRDAHGHEKPFGLDTTAGVFEGTTVLRFNANVNDTYLVSFSVTYDAVTTQNVTLILHEGDRPPQINSLCLSGTSIYLLWDAITIVPQPSFPTDTEVAQARDILLINSNAAVAAQGTANNQAITISFLVEEISIICFGSGGLVYLRRIYSRLRGVAG